MIVRPRGTTGRSRRGFTLLETILASTVAALVLLAALSMFLTLARTEQTLAARFDQTNEMAWLQLTVRRALLSLVMDENTSVDDDGNWIVPEGQDLPPRGRIMLAPDPLAEAYVATGKWKRPDGAAQMQRFEVVLDAPPVPDALMGPAAGWATRAPADAMDFSLADIAGEDTGGVRGVFELRPDGVRERIMRSVGLAGEDWPVREDNDPRAGWTLWWREYSVAEIGALTAGGTLQPDDATTPEGQERLMRAYPLVRGIEAIRWMIFSDSQRTEAYAALAQKDLPAYIELEVRTTTGKYANWMFEVAWRIGADPSEDETTTTTTDTDEDAGNSTQIQGGGAGGPGGGGGRRGPGGARTRGGQGDVFSVQRGQAGQMGQPRVQRPPPPPPGNSP
ncbi:MAG: prepilin-type N-terminal cleavage/methylation domain-containing protein [Phycisphaerales bacterium]